MSGTATDRSSRGWSRKGSRCAGGPDDLIISLYADGMTVHDIQHHLAVGVALDGVKHVLGIWVQASAGPTLHAL